mgnify:CR=1 FL=1
MTTGYERLSKVATKHGWTVGELTAWGWVQFKRRGNRAFFVKFSKRGGVLSAAATNGSWVLEPREAGKEKWIREVLKAS